MAVPRRRRGHVGRSALALEALTDGKERIGAREGYLVVSLLWLLVAVFGALPYVLAEPQLAHPVDALFESMSGFSTTGATAVADVAALSRSMAMWRQFTAWIGGVGIIVLFLAVLPRLRVGGRQALFKTEWPGPELPLAATIRETARRFVLLYVGITAAEIARARRCFGWTGIDPRMTLFNATAHSFATIATAGLLDRAALARAVRARDAVGGRRLHARRRDELRAALRRHRGPPAAAVPPRRGVPRRARAPRRRRRSS